MIDYNITIESLRKASQSLRDARQALSDSKTALDLVERVHALECRVNQAMEDEKKREEKIAALERVLAGNRELAQVMHE
jgi:hypothetical protein